VARRSILKFSFGLGALILLLSAPLRAQEVDCRNIRKCSTLLHQYEVAAGACRAEVTAHRCADGNRKTEYGQYLRDCSPETMCEEAKWFSTPLAAIPGCTGVIQKQAQDFWAGAQACYHAGAYTCSAAFFPEFGRQLINVPVSAVTGFVHFVGEGLGIVAHPVQAVNKTNESKKLFERGWACFNPEGRFRMLCDLAGGTFSRVMMGRMLMGGVRAVATGAIEESPVVVARRTRVVERGRASAGLPASRPKIIAETRARAKAGVIAAAANDFVSPKQAPPAPAKKAAGDVQRESYISRLVGRQNTTVEQRRAFADLAFRAEAKGDMVFVDMQNSKMKYLNDHLGDKNIVTAITNARIQATFDELRAKYPQLEKIEYDDFKSARIGFKFKDGKVPAGFLEDLRHSLSQAEDKFIAELGEFDVVPKGSDLLPPDKWFAAGTGLTPDEANLACRYAARTCSSVVDFRSSRVLENLSGRLSKTETLRKGTMPILKKYNGLSKTLANGQVIPTAPVYEAYRKAESATQFQQMIFERTRQMIPLQTATNLFNYLKQVDEWSTGLLLVEDRQSVTFAGAKYNGITIDVSGMGALNMETLVASLAGETDVMSAMPKARKAERAATAEFERNKASIVEAARTSLKARGIEADIRVSGDDIIVLPTTRALTADDMEAVHDAVAKSPSSSNVRLSAVTSGAKEADQLAVAGETVEKKVRGVTLSSVDDQSRYTLMVVTDAGGKPTLRISARQGSVPSDVEQAYQAAFREVIAK